MSYALGALAATGTVLAAAGGIYAIVSHDEYQDHVMPAPFKHPVAHPTIQGSGGSGHNAITVRGGAIDAATGVSHFTWQRAAPRGGSSHWGEMDIRDLGNGDYSGKVSGEHHGVTFIGGQSGATMTGGPDGTSHLSLNGAPESFWGKLDIPDDDDIHVTGSIVPGQWTIKVGGDTTDTFVNKSITGTGNLQMSDVAGIVAAAYAT